MRILCIRVGVEVRMLGAHVRVNASVDLVLCECYEGFMRALHESYVSFVLV
jgi:hypothetical protein